jgi:hypothetical protein
LNYLIVALRFKKKLHEVSKIIEAIAKIETLAGQYREKQDSNWICYVNTDGDVCTFDALNSETYCEDCIEKAVLEVTTNKELSLPEDFSEFTYSTETSKEGEDFCVCSDCGEIIHQSIIFTSDEIRHWLSLSDSEFKNALDSARKCFEIKTLLEEGEALNALSSIAMRVVNNL